MVLRGARLRQAVHLRHKVYQDVIISRPRTYRAITVKHLGQAAGLARTRSPVHLEHRLRPLFNGFKTARSMATCPAFEEEAATRSHAYGHLEEDTKAFDPWTTEGGGPARDGTLLNRAKDFSEHNPYKTPPDRHVHDPPRRWGPRAPLTTCRWRAADLVTTWPAKQPISPNAGPILTRSSYGEGGI